MGDNVFTTKDETAKPDKASPAFLEAQKHLSETHINLASVSALDAENSTASLKNSLMAAAAGENKPPTTAHVEANNGLLHLTGLAITSTAKGLWEPLAGGIQITEQVANAATLNMPGVHKAYLHPENLTPQSTTPAPEKYSKEWVVTNIFENVGKLPWYYAAGKAMSKVPGFKAEAGLISESGMLGMNMKSAAASGFIVGGLTPTEVSGDTTLTASLKERGIQASLGAGQMALVSLGTTFAGKGVAVGEKALLGKAEAVTAEQALVHAAELTPKTIVMKSAQVGLKFAKNGSIASVGAIPAGLIAGYANAKIHGTDFDPGENIAATMTVGFGLGAIGGGSHEAARSPVAREVSSPLITEGRASLKPNTEVVSPEKVATRSLPVGKPGETTFSLTPTDVSTASPITTRARARMAELAERARAAFIGGSSDHGFAFNSNDGGPESPLNKGIETGAKSPKPDEAAGPADDATPPLTVEKPGFETERPRTEELASEAPKEQPAPESEQKQVHAGEDEDAATANARRERTFKAKAATPEELEKYKVVFDSLMEASRTVSTPEHEADFIKAAVSEPWAVQKLRVDVAEHGIATEHITGLLDRANKAIRDTAAATEKVPSFARPSFDQGYDLLRNVADAQKASDMRDGLKALRSFINDSDSVLPAKDQLRSAAGKIGGPELTAEFDKAMARRYAIGYVHQVDNAAAPGAKDQFVEIRSTQVENFKSVLTQAQMVAEGTDALITDPDGKVVAPQSTLEQRYIRLRQLSENLDPDLKTSLINYASKTNDVRFRALINDIVADPRGENLPNRPIRLDHIPALEPAWDKIESRLAAHPKPAAPGEAPSSHDVAIYRKNVFDALTENERTSPGVINLAKQYARQTNNSFEASALDFYFGSSRLNAFDSVKQAKTESVEVAENRDTFKQIPSALRPLDLEAGQMKPFTDYLDRVIARLGDKDAPDITSWNGSAPVESLLVDAYQKFTDRGVTRGKFKDRPDGLFKVISQPDESSGIYGGRKSTAYFENHPNGVVQVDDFADGTRWIQEKPAGEPESSTAFFANGTAYTYFNPQLWSIDFPNGNYIYAYPEGTSEIAREIHENGKTTQVLRDGTTRVIGDTSTSEPQTGTDGGAASTVETLMETMRTAQSEKGRIGAAETLKGQAGSMDDAQFKGWLDAIRELPPEANARPAYLKMSGMRGMHALFESGILDDPAAQKSFKEFLTVPAEGDFKFDYPQSMAGVTADQMPPAMANDVRARFSAKAADGATVYAQNLPPELRSYFENNKPYELKDKWDNELPSLGKDNLAARLAAIPELASFKPQTATRLLKLGAQDPRALSDVMQMIKEPRNDIPAMRALLAETIPNADDIYTVKVLLDSIDGARKAYKTPALKETNRNLALTALAHLTSDVPQDIRLGEKVDEIIKAPGGGKGSPDTSRMAATLDLLPRTKVDATSIAPLDVLPETEHHDAKAENTDDANTLTPSTNISGASHSADGQTEIPAPPGAAADEVLQPPASPESMGTTTLEPSTDKTVAQDAPVIPTEPVIPTVENLVDKMNSTESDKVRLAAAHALKGQLSTMTDAQFQDWLTFVRQDSLETPIRPNYMKMSGMRSLADLLDSNMLDDPGAAKALRDYMTAPKPGEFKLPYPHVLQAMNIADMPPALLNDIRDRFSIKGPDGLIFQADVPPEMQDYLNNNARLRVTDNKGRRLPDLQADTLDTRVAVSSQLAQFKPETAARLLELGAQDPRALSDVIRLMKEPRNDSAKMRNLLAETIPNADNVYELKLMLDSMDAARWAFSPDRANERELNQNLALKALSELTGDTPQDLRLTRDVQDIIRSKGYIKDPKPSRMASELSLAERSKPALHAAYDGVAGSGLNAAEIAAFSTETATPVATAQGDDTYQQAAPAQTVEAAPLTLPVTEERVTTVIPAPVEVAPITQSQVETVTAPEFNAPATHVDAVEPTAQATVESSLPARAPAPEARALSQPEQVQESAIPPAPATSEGSSRINRFNERQRKVQQPTSKPASTQTSGSGAKSGKSGRPTQTINNLADLGKFKFGGTPDADDIAGTNKSSNADTYDQKAQGRKRDELRRNRDDDGDE